VTRIKAGPALGNQPGGLGAQVAKSGGWWVPFGAGKKIQVRILGNDYRDNARGNRPNSPKTEFRKTETAIDTRSCSKFLDTR